MKYHKQHLFLMFILCASAFGFLLNEKDRRISPLQMSLKPAAIPLMASGKAIARSGELLIDLSSSLDLYGGGLSAAGAQIRNAGDCVAQAAASCRFKTAAELVCDELREGATCMLEATDKLKVAVEEAKSDNEPILAFAIEKMSDTLSTAGNDLEEAGAFIMTRRSVSDVGAKIGDCGRSLEDLSKGLLHLAPEKAECQESSQRMEYGAKQMIEAANELQGVKKSGPKGKGWLKQ